jgi:hypothetical protein
VILGKNSIPNDKQITLLLFRYCLKDIYIEETESCKELMYGPNQCVALVKLVDSFYQTELALIYEKFSSNQGQAR